MAQEPSTPDTTPGLLILGEDGALYFIPDSDPTKVVRFSSSVAEEALRFVKQHLPAEPYQFAVHGQFVQYPPTKPVECCLANMPELRKLFKGE
jgi:hypothetical protein